MADKEAIVKSLLIDNSSYDTHQQALKMILINPTSYLEEHSTKEHSTEEHSTEVGVIHQVAQPILKSFLLNKIQENPHSDASKKALLSIASHSSNDNQKAEILLQLSTEIAEFNQETLTTYVVIYESMKEEGEKKKILAQISNGPISNQIKFVCELSDNQHASDFCGGLLCNQGLFDTFATEESIGPFDLFLCKISQHQALKLVEKLVSHFPLSDKRITALMGDNNPYQEQIARTLLSPKMMSQTVNSRFAPKIIMKLYNRADTDQKSALFSELCKKSKKTVLDVYTLLILATNSKDKAMAQQVIDGCQAEITSYEHDRLINCAKKKFDEKFYNLHIISLEESKEDCAAPAGIDQGQKVPVGEQKGLSFQSDASSKADQIIALTHPVDNGGEVPLDIKMKNTFFPVYDEAYTKEEQVTAQKNLGAHHRLEIWERFNKVPLSIWHRAAIIEQGVTTAIMSKEPEASGVQKPVFLDYNLTQSLRKIPLVLFPNAELMNFKRLHVLKPVQNKFIKEWIAGNKDTKAVVISLANAYQVGGYPWTHCAQEEALVHTTDLLWRAPYQYPSNGGLHALGHTYMISGVTQSKLGAESKLELNGSPFHLAFSAAPDFNDDKLRTYVNTPEGRINYIEYMTQMVRLQCEYALQTKGKLVPGALGCGAFMNNPFLVAAIYHSVLCEDKYKDIDAEFVIKYEDRPDSTIKLNLEEIFNYVFRNPLKITLSILKHSQPYEEELSGKITNLNEQNILIAGKNSIITNTEEIEAYIASLPTDKADLASSSTDHAASYAAMPAAESLTRTLPIAPLGEQTVSDKRWFANHSLKKTAAPSALGVEVTDGLEGAGSLQVTSSSQEGTLKTPLLKHQNVTKQNLDSLEDRKSSIPTKKQAAIFGGSTLVLAGIGAAIGSVVFPGVGTLIGAAIGAGIGGGVALIGGGLYAWITGLKKNSALARGLGFTTTIISSAGIGALVGTFIFPGLGTLVGAAIGAAAGVISDAIAAAVIINRTKQTDSIRRSTEPPIAQQNSGSPIASSYSIINQTLPAPAPEPEPAPEPAPATTPATTPAPASDNASASDSGAKTSPPLM